MSLSHATEKFGGAHGTLLTGQGVFRERLRNAAMEILQVEASNTDLPVTLQGRIQSVQQQLTWADQDEHRDGKLGATLRRTGDGECAAIADEIGEIAHALHTEMRSRIDSQSAEPDTSSHQTDEPPDLVM